MANIRENKKNGKVISFRFTVCLERDVRGKQIRKYTTWTAPADLTPAKARKAAERAADAWDEEVKAEYQKQKELGSAYRLPSDRWKVFLAAARLPDGLLLKCCVIIKNITMQIC